MGDLDMLTTDEMRGDLKFKYYKVSGGKCWLHAIYQPPGQEYQHSIVVPLPIEVADMIDQRIYESLLAVQSYDYEHPAGAEPPEIIKSNPRKVPAKDPIAGESVIVTPKTPQQLVREAEEAADKKLAES